MRTTLGAGPRAEAASVLSHAAGLRCWLASTLSDGTTFFTPPQIHPAILRSSAQDLVGITNSGRRHGLAEGRVLPPSRSCWRGSIQSHCSTPQGTVGHSYDAAGRRTSLTVAGQAAINYSYDNANRLTGITQGTAAVSFAYDSANRRTTLTLPNGIIMSYSYDTASQLTGINYTLGQNNLGNLAYSYDLAGRRTSVGGSFAAVNLPLPVSTTAYDAANELTAWGTASLDCDGHCWNSSLSH